MKNNSWDDHYTRKARDEKWLARSVYKLQEIDQKYKIIRKGMQLLDLGCCPGSWAQYALNRTGMQGIVTGIDLDTPSQLSSPNFRFIQADILNLDIEFLKNQVSSVDIVLSDLAPKTTGISATDVGRSIQLAEKASEIAFSLLKNKGKFVCKIFEGEEIKHFKSGLSVRFQDIRMFRPQAVRKRSREVYLIGFEYKGLSKEEVYVRT